MSELYLVRHAQACFGAANYDQLSDLGHRQSRYLGDYFKCRNLAFDQYIVGDMHRHHQTMDGICSALDIDSSDRIILPGLNEYNFQQMMQAYGDSFADDPLYQTIMRDPLDKKITIVFCERYSVSGHRERCHKFLKSGSISKRVLMMLSNRFRQ